MFTVLLITALLAYVLAYLFRRRSKLPPGPFPLPILGNLPQIAWMARKHGGFVGAMKQWKKQYGPVFTVWMGPQPTVHITTMELAQETMIKRGNEFTERWVPVLFNVARNHLGIIGTSGDHWVEQRRFALHTLRNFGLGRGLMEDRIMEEFNYRTKKLDEKLNGQEMEVDPHDIFDVMVGSIINRMLFNEALDERNGAQFYEQKKTLDNFLERLSVLDLLVRKSTKHWPIIKNRLDKMAGPQFDVMNFLKRQVKERREAIEKGEHIIMGTPDDYVDAFLLKMKEEEGQEGSTYTEESLVVNLMNLWIAGQDTTVTTIMAAFVDFCVIRRKFRVKIISKVREELLKVTKGERHLSLKDKANTPYFNATVMDIQRPGSIININLFRRTAEDTVVGGHPVEKGTPISAQISLLMSESGVFADAEKFDPSRFLNDDKIDQHVIPFGIGKRSCLGESLARAELYLILGNMILRYDLKPTEVLPQLCELNNIGIFRRPGHFTMLVRKF